MLHSFLEWMKHPFQVQEGKQLLDDYNVTFSSLHGQRVLQHLLDNVYCTVYIGSDPMELASHNARRSVIQEILTILDQARAPEKYSINVKTEEREFSNVP